MTHTVAAVWFVRRTNDGPCECVCGWSGRAAEFAAHRLAVNAPSRRKNHVLGPADPVSALRLRVRKRT